MKKYAFLFPGQGAQVPGMIKDICDAYPEARAVVDEVTKITGVDMPKLLWESDAATLSRSDNSQLAITTASLAVMAVLKTKGIEPSAATWCRVFDSNEKRRLYRISCKMQMGTG